ncbi:MAG: hypothetical protein ABIS45_05165 [Burkholderiales bacterium]
MSLNPLLDPFVETGYLGYSLRGIAHRRPDATYQPSLQIRNYRCSFGGRLYDGKFRDLFFDPESAIEHALGKGRQIVDDHVERRIRNS